MRSLSTACMLPAALGFLVFTSFLLFRVDLEKVTVQVPGGPRIFILLYSLTLFPSALWMPLTFAWLDSSSVMLWTLDVLALVLVALAGLVMLTCLLRLRPRLPALHYWASVVGCVLFCIQTVIMDALLWVFYF